MDNGHVETSPPGLIFPVMQSEFLAMTVERACAAGADRIDILKGCLVRPEILEGPSRPVPSACVYLASTRAASVSGNPHICAEIARGFDWWTGFSIPHTFGSSASLGDLLLAWLQFVDTVQVSMQYRLIVEGPRAVLAGRRTMMASQPPGQADAWDLSSWVQMLKASLGSTWNGDQVDAEVYEPSAIPPDLLPETRVRTSDAWGLSISFPAPWLMRRSEVVPQRSNTGTPITQNVDLETLFEVFDYSVWPGLDGFARFLGFHPKALQREFNKRGTTGANLTDGARSKLAAIWLADGRLSIGAVGRKLGYTNASAFTRACHRWFGCSPEEWRAYKPRQSSS